jgi:hypothetical protein
MPAWLAEGAMPPGFAESALEQAIKPANTRIELPKTSAFNELFLMIPPCFCSFLKSVTWVRH